MYLPIYQLFGISMDWFAGFSNIPYTNTSIENAEDFMLKTLIEIDKNSTYKSFYPNEYLNTETRKNYIPYLLELISLFYLIVHIYL